MAQTNFTPILLYASSTPTNVPSAGNLTNSATGSEIAINIADKNLFFKDSTNAVNTVPIRQSSTSSNGWLSSTDWNTFNGKAPATSGTSILYGNGTGGFNNVTIGSGISFAAGTLSATGTGGTVTSVTGTSPVVSSGGTTPAISLATAYGDTLNPYASKTANYVLAAPNGSAGVPTFRALVAADVTGLGTMATQNANAVAITGGTINGTTIGATTATTGAFTTVTASTSLTTPTVQATNSAGLALKNSAGTTQISMGAGGGDNVTIAVSTNLNGTNAQIDISPTGTGHVHIKPSGTGAVEIAPTNAGTMNNMVIGGTTPLAITGTTITATTFVGSGSSLTGVVTSVGATSPVTSTGGQTPTIAMPAATTSVSGYLTSTDWNTFNNKGNGTVTSVTGTAPVVSSGGATPAISMAAATGSVNGYLTSTDWTTFNNKGSGTVTSVAALTLGTSGTDLSSTVATGTTTPVITLNVPTASATNRGALSAADWTTFNGKAPAFTYTSNYIPYGQGTTTPTQSVGLQYNGTTFTTTGISTSNNLTFTGTGNRIFGDFSSASLANRVAFQTSTTNDTTTVDFIPNGTGTLAQIALWNNSNTTNAAFASYGCSSTALTITAGISGTGTYLPITMFTGGSERLRVDTSGNVGINTASPTAKVQIFSDGAPAASGNMTTGMAIASAAGSYAINIGADATAGYTWLNSAFINSSNTASAMVFMTGATERMRISTTGIVTMSAYGAGAATFSAAGVISSVSDETWKIKDGVPINPDEMLKKLEPGYWFYNEEKAPIFGKDRQLGFYAQNVNSAIGSEAAPTPEEGKPWGYYDRSVLAVTVMSLKNALNTIQELNNKFDAYVASHP